MIGSKLDKITHQKGQVLLLVVMLIATVLTIVLASSFRTVTETQTTKLEEESQKALAAAEAGIEAALKQGSVNIGDLTGLSGYTGSATVQETTSSNFITPLLQKDEQYTLYLSTPDKAPDNPDFTRLNSSYNNKPLTICSTSDVALEITLIKTSSIARYAINPPSLTIIQNGQSANGAGQCPSEEDFAYKHQLSSTNIGSNNLLLIVRIIGDSSSKIGFHGSTNLPFQGKTIVSKATSPGGVTKEVILFQSYPQIPAEFFVTSF